MVEKISGIPKIFIGSSNKAYELVKWLAEQIRSYNLAIPIEWKTGGFAPSKSTLQNLIDQCRVCDFAVLFFTRDDNKLSGGDQTGNPLDIFKGPRDNMIFEAGFFVGGLGLQPERCLLVSSVEERTLPSDLKGVTYIKIDEPPPPEPPYNRLSEEWCREHLQGVLESVVYSVNKHGEFLYRPLLKILTKKELAEREQVGKDCLEKYDRVVFNSSEPEDLCEFDLARAIAENIKNFVYYDFHFKISETNYENVGSQFIDLIRILMATYCIGEKKYSEGDLKQEKDIKDFLCLKENRVLIESAINDFKKRLNIFIHKYTHPIPFRISVHNVSSFDRAKCYLRHGEFYVEWFLRDEAREAIDILKNNEEEEVEFDKKGKIIQTTDNFDLYSEEITEDVAKKFRKDPNGEIKKLIDEKINDYNLKNIEDRSKFIKIIKTRLRTINNHRTDLEKKLRKTLMKKIIDLFPDELWAQIRELCFGNDIDFVMEEWENISKKGNGSIIEKGVLSVMKKINDIHITDTVNGAWEKIKSLPGKCPVRVYGKNNDTFWETDKEKLERRKQNDGNKKLEELSIDKDNIKVIDDFLDILPLFEKVSDEIKNSKSDNLPQVNEKISNIYDKLKFVVSKMSKIFEKCEYMQSKKDSLSNMLKKINGNVFQSIYMKMFQKIDDLPFIEPEIFTRILKSKDGEKENDEIDNMSELLGKNIDNIKESFEILRYLLVHRTEILAEIQIVENWEDVQSDADLQNMIQTMKDLLSYDILLAPGETDGRKNDYSVAYISKLQKVSFANKLFKSMPDCNCIVITDNGKKTEKWLGVIDRNDLLYAYEKK
ncbi:MAG: nucleotide-binding protein [Chitinispirillaceae bacterium]|nr:nucleotide-binding protein [Chitinispirillaceae bacterium]